MPRNANIRTMPAVTAAPTYGRTVAAPVPRSVRKVAGVYATGVDNWCLSVVHQTTVRIIPDEARPGNFFYSSYAVGSGFIPAEPPS